MEISYDHYKFFYYVARYGNITRAAKMMYSNQPNVTRAVKNLENELGCTLFVRTNKGVELTPEGEKLYAHVEVAFEQLKLGEEEIAAEKGLQSGIVTVAATEVALGCCLLPVLGEFHRQFPKVKLRITNSNTREALSVMQNKAADLAVVTLSESSYISKELSCIPIKEVNEKAVINSELYDFKKKTVSLTELLEYPLISLSRNTETYALYEEWFRSYGITFSPDVEAATAGQIIPMVKSGLGVGFIPEEFPTDDSIRTIHLKEKLPVYRICLIKQKAHTLSAAADQIEKLLRARYQHSSY